MLCRIDTRASRTQALSHFSYVDSKTTHLLTDVQGWRNKACQYILTDPAFHTDTKKTGGLPGGSDRGHRGMRDFFKAHTCAARTRVSHNNGMRAATHAKQRCASAAARAHVSGRPPGDCGRSVRVRVSVFAA